MDSPFLRRLAANGLGDSGRKAEKHIARRIKGELTPASGAMASVKGDVVKKTDTHTLMLENKTTIGASISIKQEYLRKVYQEALETNRTPALSFQFVNLQGHSDKRDRWIALPEHILMQLLGE